MIVAIEVVTWALFAIGYSLAGASIVGLWQIEVPEPGIESGSGARYNRWRVRRVLVAGLWPVAYPLDRAAHGFRHVLAGHSAADLELDVAGLNERIEAGFIAREAAKVEAEACRALIDPASGTERRHPCPSCGGRGIHRVHPVTTTSAPAVLACLTCQGTGRVGEF